MKAFNIIWDVDDERDLQFYLQKLISLMEWKMTMKFQTISVR